jgi:hypothetical protein
MAVLLPRDLSTVAMLPSDDGLSRLHRIGIARAHPPSRWRQLVPVAVPSPSGINGVTSSSARARSCYDGGGWSATTSSAS